MSALTVSPTDIQFRRVKELPKRLYKMRCEVLIGAYPRKEHLRAALKDAHWKFVRDMAAQGFEYQDTYGIDVLGPIPSPKKGLPSVGQQQRDPLSYAPETVPTLAEAESWTFFLSAVFMRTAIPFVSVTPDREELDDPLGWGMERSTTEMIHGDPRQDFKRGRQ